MGFMDSTSRDIYGKLKELQIVIIKAQPNLRNPQPGDFDKTVFCIKAEDIGMLELVETQNKLRMVKGRYIERFTPLDVFSVGFKKDVSFDNDKGINLYEDYDEYSIESISMLYDDKTHVNYMIPPVDHSMRKWIKQNGMLAFRIIRVDRWKI